MEPDTIKIYTLDEANLQEVARHLLARLRGRMYTTFTGTRFPDGWCEDPIWRHRQQLVSNAAILAYPATGSVEILDTSGVHLLSALPAARASVVQIETEAIHIQLKAPSGNVVHWSLIFTGERRSRPRKDA